MSRTENEDIRWKGSMSRTENEDDSEIVLLKLASTTPLIEGKETKYARWEGKRAGILFIITIAGFFSSLTTSIFLPAIPSIIRDLNTTEFMVALAVSTYFIVTGSGPLFWGPMSDRYSRRISLLVGISVHCVTSVMCGFVWNIESLIAFRVLQAFGVSSLLVIGAGIISDIYPPEVRGDALGLFTMAPSVGPLFGPIIGGSISQFLGWKWTFWILAIACFFLFICGYFLVPETRTKDESTMDPTETLWRSILKPLKFLLTPSIILLCLGNAICHCASSSTLILFPTLLSQFSLNELYLGLCYIPFGVMAMVGSKMGGVLTDKTGSAFGKGGRLVPSIVGIAFYTVSAIQFAFSEDLWVILLATAMLGFFFAFQRPGIYAYVIQEHPKNSAGVSASLLFIQFGLAFVAVTVGPLIWTTKEGKMLFYVGLGVLAFVASVPVMILAIWNWKV